MLSLPFSADTADATMEDRFENGEGASRWDISLPSLLPSTRQSRNIQKVQFPESIVHLWGSFEGDKNYFFPRMIEY